MEYTECCLWVSRVSQSLVLANRTAARTALSYCAPLPSFEPAMDTSGVPDPASMLGSGRETGDPGSNHAKEPEKKWLDFSIVLLHVWTPGLRFLYRIRSRESIAVCSDPVEL
eukprot:5908486-Pyramimonas_sp.AAC.1